MRQLHRSLRTLAELPRSARTALVVAFDFAGCTLAALAAFWLRLGEWHFFTPPVVTFIAIAVPIWFAVAVPMGVYRSLVRFSGRESVAHIIATCATMAVLLGFVLLSLRIEGIPRTLAILHPLLFALALSAGRLALARLLQHALIMRHSQRSQRRVLIYGAGPAGQQLSLSVRQDPDIRVIGFVDENETLRGRRLERRPIWHTNDLDRVLALQNVDEVFLALSTSRQMRRAIVERIHRSASGIRVRALPSVAELARGKVTVSDLKEVQIEELLGRDEVAPNPTLMSQTIGGKCVLVTGAGGSIGSELCRQILFQRPLRLILVDHSELGLYSIEGELRQTALTNGLPVELVPLLVDVSDRTACDRVFRTFRPQTVFHAAAYKHVPLLELNPLAGIRNNVLGTLNCALASEEAEVGHFLLVSTDKAVRPTSVMGASKRVCELIVQARAALQRRTVYSAVRFGNVLGSSGSVVPLFKRQIAAGGPVTVTDYNATRFFMTIPEASQLVIQAGAMAEGGEVFLLDMGEPVRIYDLARTMIELSGLTVLDENDPDGDIEIVEVGLRSGEKLVEELLIGESSSPTLHPRIVKARETMIDWAALSLKLEFLQIAISENDIPSAVSTVLGLARGEAADAQPAPLEVLPASGQSSRAS